MYRVPRRRHRAPILFGSLIDSDLHHARFQHHDLASLSDDKLWAEHIELQRALARLILTDNRELILGSDYLHCTRQEVSKTTWARERLQHLRDERSRRAAAPRQGWAA
jgi:hypothetical protein